MGKVKWLFTFRKGNLYVLLSLLNQNMIFYTMKGKRRNPKWFYRSLMITSVFAECVIQNLVYKFWKDQGNILENIELVNYLSEYYASTLAQAITILWKNLKWVINHKSIPFISLYTSTIVIENMCAFSGMVTLRTILGKFGEIIEKKTQIWVMTTCRV